VEDPVDNRLAELERRIAALESTAAGPRRQAATGRAGTGQAEAAGAEAARALAALRARREWSAVAPTLAALGSPIRLTLLREIVRGHVTVNSLSQVEGLGTSGQIYHHLRHLTAEGWLHTPTRGTFAIPPARATALNAILRALEH
jgi:DNA-binding transcriptional ArsR family regulator